MHLYFQLGPIQLPGYGIMIALGVIIANAIAFWAVKRKKLNIYDYLILISYGLLGGIIGAKLLFLLTYAPYINWTRITDPIYFNSLMQGGFVFYGGLIGGLLLIILAGRWHKIEAGIYFRSCIFVIPLMHAFGRIGCFMAGCCYGIPYDGPGAVVFPENSMAPAGVSLFPVQLVESLLLFILGFILLYLCAVRNSMHTPEIYIASYAIIRFVLEKFRYDEIRGKIFFFSTSQWISILMLAVALIMFLIKRKRIGSRRFEG